MMNWCCLQLIGWTVACTGTECVCDRESVFAEYCLACAESLQFRPLASEAAHMWAESFAHINISL